MKRLPLLLVAIAIAAAFVLGRATGPDAASAGPDGRVYTGRFGDVFRVPAAATRCLVGAEAGAARVTCSHTPVAQARYSVVFFSANLFVYRNGRPDDPVFSARGKP